MPVVAVSFDRNERPSMRTVQLRTPALLVGVLCEVWADERMHLCVVQSVNSDGSMRVRRLPEPPSPDQVQPPRHRPL